MKRRIVILILCVFILSGCQTLSNTFNNRTEKINEELISDYKNDSYNSLNAIVKKETVSDPDNNEYYVRYYDPSGNTVKIEEYNSEDDMLISTLTDYSKVNGSKTVIEYNPEYYDRFDPGIPGVKHFYVIRDILYYGKSTSSLKNPSMQSCPYIYERYYSNGAREIGYYLLNSFGEQYFDFSEQYDEDGNLVTVRHGDPDHDWDQLRMERYEYENGELIRKIECDLVEKTAVCTDYKDGEAVSTETWIIDEYGNRIE